MSAAQMRRVLALADRLAADAEREGIEIQHLSAYADSRFSTITMLLADRDPTPAFALTLGLPRYDVYAVADRTNREVFQARIDGVEVTTFHDVPASVAAVLR